MAGIHHCSILRSIFTALKILCSPPAVYPSLPPLQPLETTDFKLLGECFHMHDSLHSSDNKTDNFSYLKHEKKNEAYRSEMHTKLLKSVIRRSQNHEHEDRRTPEAPH